MSMNETRIREALRNLRRGKSLLHGVYPVSEKQDKALGTIVTNLSELISQTETVSNMEEE